MIDRKIDKWKDICKIVSDDLTIISPLLKTVPNDLLKSNLQKLHPEAISNTNTSAGDLDKLEMDEAEIN